MLKFLLLFTMFSGHVLAKGSAMVGTVIQDYFEGYQKANVAIIKKAFHPETQLLSVNGAVMDVTTMKDWLIGLEERNRREDFRIGKLTILSVDQTHNTAIAKVRMTFPSFEFTDYLSFLKLDDQWVIVGKIYHYQPL